MRFFFLFFFVASVAPFLCIEARTFTDTQMTKLMEFGRECEEETKVDKDVLTKMVSGGSIEFDTTLMKYAKCFLRKTSARTEDGTMTRDKFVEGLPDSTTNKEALEKLFDKCKDKMNSDESSEEDDKTWKFAKCLRDDTFKRKTTDTTTHEHTTGEHTHTT